MDRRARSHAGPHDRWTTGPANDTVTPMARPFTPLLLAVGVLAAPLLAQDFTCGNELVDARDGRSYPTVPIGDQCWLGRNLDHGHEVSDALPRDEGAIEKTCYANDPESCRVYGGLYTWTEAMQGSREAGARGVCPAGWHLPARAEWQALAEHLGPATAGQRLKARVDHEPPYDGTDDVGFTALAGGSGFRGSFGRQGHWALFWTSTEVSAERAASVQLDRFWYPAPPRYRKLVIDDFYLKENAFSVRCLQDREAPGPSAHGAQSPSAGRRRRSRVAAYTRGRRSSRKLDFASPERPNILCITCEDISPRLGSYGDTVALTPVLDRLAREGVRFTRVFSVSGVCAPSRAALITGMYPSGIGANHMRTSQEKIPGLAPYETVPPPYVRPFTEYLRAAGYYTTNNAKTDYQFKAPITAWDENGREAHWRNRPEGMPFFSIFNLTTTHESQVWVRADDPVVVPPERVLLPPYYPDTPTVRRDVARVYSNVAIMDREVGELLAELEEAGLAENTIVIWYSDHGGPMPRQKRLVLDSGLHVPFIMRFPDGAHAGTVNDELVSFVDIPATILSLAGVELPQYMQGRPFWGEQKAPPREYVYAARDRLDERYDAVRAVRDTRFEYIRNFKPEVSAYLDVSYRRQMGIMQELLRLRDEGELDPVQARWFRRPKEREELYDTLADPHEVHDLARDPAYAGEVERLRRALAAWMERIGDDPLRSEEELVESMWPGHVQPRTAAPAVSWRDGRVEIECPTEGAAVAYQIDGRGYGPDHWLLYTGPFEVPSGSLVSATAIRVGYAQSGTVGFEVP
jgi:N-sulfoglucosamine sulfohydrolase